METKQGDRDISGGLTSKCGFSVVAPISTISPSSTAGSSVSCWALLNRCTSSRNRIVSGAALAESVTSRRNLFPHVLSPTP